MPETRTAAAGAASPRAGQLALVGLACLGLILALYQHALHLYFVGDDLWFVRPNPHWLRDAWLPSSTIFHYYPVNQMLLSGLPALTGYRPEFMHALNFVLCAGIGAALFAFLRQLGASLRAALIAPIVCLARAVNYEVIIWITELSYLLVVALTLLTAITWDRYVRGGRAGDLAATVAGFAVAVLTIEHALLMLPLYWLIEWAARGRIRDVTAAITRPVTAVSWLRAQAVRYLPFALVVVAFFAVKLGMKGGLLLSNVAPAPTVAAAAADHPRSGERVLDDLPPERMVMGFLNSPKRAYLDLLLSTGYAFLPIGVARGAQDTWLTRHPWLVLVPWLAFHALILWKGGPLPRFLLIWMYLYLLPLAVAGVPQARYYFMATVPAAGLVGLGLDATLRRLKFAPAAMLNVALGVLLALLVWGEAGFIRARIREWTLASDLVRGTVHAMRDDLGDGPHEVYLMNFPRGVPGPFWTAYAFVVATEHLPLMLHPPRTDVVARPVYDRTFVPERWPTVGTYASRAETLEKLRDPRVVAYEFLGRPPWIERMR